MILKVIKELLAIIPVFLCGFILGFYLKSHINTIREDQDKSRDNYFKKIADECSRLERQMEELAKEVQYHIPSEYKEKNNKVDK